MEPITITKYGPERHGMYGDEYDVTYSNGHAQIIRGRVPENRRTMS